MNCYLEIHVQQDDTKLEELRSRFLGDKDLNLLGFKFKIVEFSVQADIDYRLLLPQPTGWLTVGLKLEQFYE